MHIWGIQRVEGASSFVTLGLVILCDFKFKWTENHNFDNNNQYKPACGILSLLDILIIDNKTFKFETYFEVIYPLLVVDGLKILKIHHCLSLVTIGCP